MGKQGVNGRQIRVVVEKRAYERLKARARKLRMTLEQYSGLYLSGYRVIKAENEEEEGQ